ncbi:hypothetical protein K503DRAFT_777897 [Rhizopogon vinicolor AM-OR11-026]|uniref:Uncharacterized protein n=1 Tax=Rhizopogon vinicolor AM-OR11-026 TaxID=1314800 RepID=A0A1B7MEG7_9AGAM|nr:hypothetical protein K503DRAFT_777897 [Rhizopogon vinicolor AM-OR11-026]
MTYNSSSEVVEVYAVRGFRRLVYTPKRKKNSPALTTNACTTAGLVNDSSPAGTPSQGGSAPVPISSHKVTGRPGLSAHAPQSSSSHYVTTHDADDGSDSDSIQGEWNNFLVKICYPCGRYHDT